MTGTELSRPLDLSKFLSLKGALFRRRRLVAVAAEEER
jgi:hypothetical protein